MRKMFEFVIIGKQQSIKFQQDEVAQKIEAHFALLQLSKSLFIRQYGVMALPSYVINKSAQ